MRTNSKHTAAIAPTLLAAVAVVSLAACGEDPPPVPSVGGDRSANESGPLAEGTSGVPQQSTASSAPSPENGQPGPGGSTGPGGPIGPGAAAGVETLLTAGETARRQLGGTVTTIDSEPSGWEVHVVLGNGTEREVGISPDGRRVVAGPFGDRDDLEDQRENQAMVQTAGLDYRAAVEAARSALPGGEIADIDLDFDDGRVTWEASVFDRGGPEQSVIIDAASGEVLFTGHDD